MRKISPERRRMCDIERNENNRMRMLEDAQYRRLVMAAREHLGCDGDRAMFELAIRNLVRDPFEFSMGWMPQLKQMYEEHRRRQMWTGHVRVTGEVTCAGLQPLAKMLCTLSRRGVLDGGTVQ